MADKPTPPPVLTATEKAIMALEVFRDNVVHGSPKHMAEINTIVRNLKLGEVKK